MSKNISEVTVAELLQLLKERPVAQPQKAKRTKKDPEAEKKPVSEGVAAWNAYVTQVKEELEAEGWKHPETGKPVTRKDAMAEASKRKAEGNAEYAAASAARRAKRDEQLAKKGSVAPEPSSPKAEEKPSAERPKKVLSPEHKAKMLAGAAAAREAKKAASVPAPVAAAPPSAPSPAEEAAEEEEPEEWIRKTISGKKHLWNPVNNHCYRCEADGSQGAWAGLYNPKTQKIDDSVAEPEDE